jgi:hypothetical protein
MFKRFFLTYFQNLYLFCNGDEQRLIMEVKRTLPMFVVFGLTRSGLEPTTYRTRGEHANHYTTDGI